MKLNSLFGAITHHLLKKPTYKVLELSIPELALTKDEQQYYRVNLTPLNICVNDFYLTEAHVSIYKMVQVDNPVLGPSHFTALFSNSAGQTFRMHLFLNSFDNISCPPTWELWDEKEGFVKADTPEFIDYLKQQLWQLGFPYVHELRRIQVELEHSFNEEYKTLEKQLSALSINLHENIDAYLNLLDDTLLLVKRLIEVSDTQHWYRIEIYLQKIKESLLSEIEKSEDSELVDPPPELNNMHVDNQLKVNNKNTLSSIPQRLFAKTKATPILERAVENKIQQIKNLFEKLRTTSDDQMQAIFLVDLYHKMLAIDLENGDVLSTSQLNELVQIESKFSQLAKTLLHKALLGKQFDLARCLSPFYNYISLDILKLALMNKNSQVLDFLVNEVQLPMNRYPLVIKNKTYANAVSYLFSEYDGNNSSMDCLNVLIVDEGSLMQPVDPMGLPFAHMLLSSEPKHPLWAILEQNKSISLDNRHFYTHLILELKQYLKMNYPDPELSMQIHHWIRNYEESCQTIKVQHNILNSRNRALLDEFSNISKTTLSTAMVDALHMDSDIKRENSYLMNELNQAIIRLKQFKRVTGKEFAYHTLVHSYTSELKDQLLKSDLKIELGFSELKYQILVYMDNVRTLIRTVIELLDVQTDILKTPQILGKRNKTYKKLQVDQTELLKKINDLNEKMPLAILKKCNDLKIAIEILDRKEQEYNNRLKLFENLLAHLQDEGEEYTDENYEAILNSLLDQSISSPGP